MNKIFTGFDLKIIAILAMTIDHIGAVFFPHIIALRIIGRLTVPILTFLIAEGYYHTKSKNKYLLRIFLFALISQIPYGLLWNNLNILFNYALILSMVRIWEYYKDKAIAVSLILLLIPFTLFCDWTWYLTLFVLVFMIFRNSIFKKTIFFLIVVAIILIHNIILAKSIYILLATTGLIASIPFIYLYNGERGKSLKYLFYIFYPLHLIILYLIKTAI